MAITLKQTKKYYKKKGKIFPIIFNEVDEEIIHGGLAVNKRLPKIYRRPTADIDLYSNRPLTEARKTERLLDAEMQFNAFEVVPGRHKGTFKLKSRATGRTRADYTKPKTIIPYDKIKGKKYMKVAAMKAQMLKTLKDKEQIHIHTKLRDSINRLTLHERMIKAKLKKKQIKRKESFW